MPRRAAARLSRVVVALEARPVDAERAQAGIAVRAERERA
jgi:hypothetical protein